MEKQEIAKEKARIVPDLKLDEHQKVLIQTKEIPLKVSGKDAVVVIRKLSTGVRNKIRSNCTQTKIVGGQPNIIVNDTEVQEQILFACIFKAPFDASINGIKELPAEVTDYIFDEYNNFAEPTEKKNEELEKD